MAHTPDQVLDEAAELFRERNGAYGDAYLRHGKLMASLFPKGITLKDENDFIRFGIFNMMMSKACRTAENFPTGGHEDSSLDASVYAAMLHSVETGDG